MSSNPASNPNGAIDQGPIENLKGTEGHVVNQPVKDIEKAADHKYATSNQHNKADDNPGGAAVNEQSRKTHSSRNNDVGDDTGASK